MVYTADDFQYNSQILRIIGFSEVINNKDKVWIWHQQVIDRPLYQDPHQLTRQLNNSQRKTDWGKTVGYKDNVLGMLFNQGEFTNRNLLEEMTDIWSTRSDGDRKFAKCIIDAPYNNNNNTALNMLIRQTILEPVAIYERAVMESNGSIETKNELYIKYKDKAKLKTFVKKKIQDGIVNLLLGSKHHRDGEYYDIYEEKDLVSSDKESIHHTFIDYREDTNTYYNKLYNDMLIKGFTKSKINKQEEKPNIIKISMND